MYSVQKVDKAWDGGTIPKEGVPCPSESTFKIGSGTLEDPHVYWICDYSRIRNQRFHACTDIARKEAISKGFRCVVIRSANHNTVLRRDGEGQRVTNRETGRLEVVPADPHITLFLGHSLYNIVLQGHVYVTVGEDDVPIDIMDPKAARSSTTARSESRGSIGA